MAQPIPGVTEAALFDFNSDVEIAAIKYTLAFAYLNIWSAASEVSLLRRFNAFIYTKIEIIFSITYHNDGEICSAEADWIFKSI